MCLNMMLLCLVIVASILVQGHAFKRSQKTTLSYTPGWRESSYQSMTLSAVNSSRVYLALRLMQHEPSRSNRYIYVRVGLAELSEDGIENFALLVDNEYPYRALILAWLFNISWLLTPSLYFDLSEGVSMSSVQVLLYNRSRRIRSVKLW